MFAFKANINEPCNLYSISCIRTVKTMYDQIFITGFPVNFHSVLSIAKITLHMHRTYVDNECSLGLFTAS